VKKSHCFSSTNPDQNYFEDRRDDVQNGDSDSSDDEDERRRRKPVQPIFCQRCPRQRPLRSRPHQEHDQLEPRHGRRQDRETEGSRAEEEEDPGTPSATPKAHLHEGVPPLVLAVRFLLQVSSRAVKPGLRASKDHQAVRELRQDPGLSHGLPEKSHLESKIVGKWTPEPSDLCSVRSGLIAALADRVRLHVGPGLEAVGTSKPSSRISSEDESLPATKISKSLLLIQNFLGFQIKCEKSMSSHF